MPECRKCAAIYAEFAMSSLPGRGIVYLDGPRNRPVEVLEGNAEAEVRIEHREDGLARGVGQRNDFGSRLP